MKILLALGLIIIGAAIGGFILSISFYSAEKKAKAKQLKEDKEYNEQMLKMCAAMNDAGKCKKFCKRCTWGTRMKDGVVYFGKGIKR